MKQNNIFIEEHHEPSFSRLGCQLLTFRQFLDPNFKKWACQEIGWQFGFNRKLWEYAFILNADALDLNGKLGGPWSWVWRGAGTHCACYVASRSTVVGV
ncbi:MAG: hypothetical protein OQL08_02200 [Gammaproteobacteria bacterium]|nr:hypothetical protein [Gammaproteobacteria bacterium]